MHDKDLSSPRRLYWMIGLIFAAGAASLLAQCALG